MSNITNYLNKVKTAIYGKDVRGAIHDAIKQVYDDASVDHDNANMEVKLARGTHNTLNDRLDNVDEIQAQTNAQLSEISNYKNTLINIMEFIPCKNENCNGNCGCVKGDGIHDDTSGIQNAIDHAWENNIKGVYLQRGTYLVTDAINLWCSSSENDKRKVELCGDGKEFTTIVKRGNKKSELNLHTEIDAILILVNSFIKEGEIAELDSSSIICRYPRLKGICLQSESISSRNDYGLYSLGIYFGVFDDIQVKYTTTGFATESWNCYNKFIRLRCDRTLYGCDFGKTKFNGQTTMNFEDCHMNGIDKCCYSILGSATFINCAIDGGGGTHYKIPGFNRQLNGPLGGRITLISCHHESPSVFSGNHIYDLSYGRLYTYNTPIEIPYTNFTSNSAMIKAENESKVVLCDGGLSYRQNASKCLGKFIDIDASSILKLNNFIIEREAFENYVHYVYNESEVISIANRVLNDITSISKYIGYVSSTTPSSERSKSDISFEDNRIKINVVNDYSKTMSNCFLFNKKVDLTEKSRILFEGDVFFKENAGTSKVNFQIILSKDWIPDGTVGDGIPVSHTLLSPSNSNYGGEDKKHYVDITDFIGEYYIGINLYGTNIEASIKELKVLR